MSVFNFLSACFSVPVDQFYSELDARGCSPLADSIVLLGGKEDVSAPVLGCFTAHPEDQ